MIFGLLIVPIFGLSSCRETDAGLQGAVSLMRHDPAEPSDNATFPRAACKNATHTPTSSNATHKPRHKDPFESRLSVGLSDDAGERSEGRKLMVGEGIEEEEAGERVGDGEGGDSTLAAQHHLEPLADAANLSGGSRMRVMEAGVYFGGRQELVASLGSSCQSLSKCVYVCVCVRARVCTCACACVRACVSMQCGGKRAGSRCCLGSGVNRIRSLANAKRAWLGGTRMWSRWEGVRWKRV